MGNCETIDLGNGDFAVICTRGRRKKSYCHYCGADDPGFLCDYPITIPGKRKRDCDVKLCEKCTRKGASGETDFCRAHYPLAKAAHERREASKLPFEET